MTSQKILSVIGTLSMFALSSGASLVHATSYVRGGSPWDALQFGVTFAASFIFFLAACGVIVDDSNL